MNKYGTLAMNHWKDVDPQRYNEIPNPTEFFSTLGDQVEQQVTDLTYRIAGPDSKTEGYLGKVGRLNTSRMQAEEIVLADLVWITPSEDEDESTDSPDPWGAMDRIHQQQENDEMMAMTNEEWDKRQ